MNENRYMRIREHLNILTFISVLFLLFIFMFSLLRFPQITAKGISYGITVCTESVIASLFPFMIISSFMLKSNIAYRLSAVIPDIYEKAFLLPKESAAVILMSFIGGYPVGAFMIKELYEQKIITKSQGLRMLTFCVNPGPSFIIGYVGAYLLGSTKAGVIIYCSIIIASLLTAVFTRNSNQYTYTKIKSKKEIQPKSSYISSFTDAVKDSTSSIISVCSFVILFSMLNELWIQFAKNDELRMLFSCIFEVTNAMGVYAKAFPLYISAAVLSFGGLCVHFQIMPVLLALRSGFPIFILKKLSVALLSALFCKLILVIFPCEISVSNITQNAFTYTGSNTGISICMLIMSIIFLLGDKTVFKIKFNFGGAVEKREKI